jgi:hypothetical protein
MDLLKHVRINIVTSFYTNNDNAPLTAQMMTDKYNIEVTEEMVDVVVAKFESDGNVLTPEEEHALYG